MNMGKRIELTLSQKNWKRSDLLERVPDLSAQALSNLIVRDSKRSEWDEVIAEALGVSVLWLVYGKPMQQQVNEPETCYSTDSSEEVKVLLSAFYSGHYEQKQALLVIAKSFLKA